MNDAKSVYLKFDTLTDLHTDEACNHKVFPNGRPKKRFLNPPMGDMPITEENGRVTIGMS